MMFRQLITFFRPRRDSVREDVPEEVQLIRMLAGQISIPAKAGHVLEEIETFARLDPGRRRSELPRIYLLLEQYLTNVDPVRTLTRPQLRNLACSNFRELTQEGGFGVVFEPSERQEILLCRSFLLGVLDRAMHVLGAGAKLAAIRSWIERAPNPTAAENPPFLLDEERPDGERPAAEPPKDWIAAFIKVSPLIFEQLHVGLGEATARIYDGAYAELARRYGGLETFPIVVRLLPDGLLDAERIQSVARHGTMTRVQDALSEAQQSALESATQLQAVLSTVCEGIVTVDAERRFVLVNREIERMFGCEADALLGQPITLLLDDVDAAFTTALGQRTAVEGRRPDGSTFPVDVCVNETRISGRLFYTAALRDVTAQQRYERGLVEAKERAEEMTRLKTAFLANMSHEVRTPLAGIMGAAEILVDEMPDSLREFTEVIANSGRRLLDTFDAVVEFALLDSGDHKVDRRPVAVRPRLEAAALRFADRAKAKGLSLEVRADDPTSHSQGSSADRGEADADNENGMLASADPASIDRILDRLLENAIRFTHVGSVRLSARAQEGRIWIEVRDTGIGISQAFLPHAFDEFRQESSGDARRHEGTGLGLAIARRLAEEMGGSLEAESTPGRGSTFRLSLEIAEVETARRARSARPRLMDH